MNHKRMLGGKISIEIDILHEDYSKFALVIFAYINHCFHNTLILIYIL